MAVAGGALVSRRGLFTLGAALVAGGAKQTAAKTAPGIVGTIERQGANAFDGVVRAASVAQRAEPMARAATQATPNRRTVVRAIGLAGTARLFGSAGKAGTSLAEGVLQVFG